MVAPPEAPARTAAASRSPSRTPRHYTVARGDTLSSIGDRFGLTIDQLLDANPQLDDPDHVEVGDVLTIPFPGDAPPAIATSAGLEDGLDDVRDRQDAPVPPLPYLDATRLTARIEGGDVLFRLVLRDEPPSVDPRGERIAYRFFLDLDADDRPDVRVSVSNLDRAAGGYSPALVRLLDGRRTGRGAFPGEGRIEGESVFVRLHRDALGSPRRIAIAAVAERVFYLDRHSRPPRTEVALDRIPDHQWPRQAPRWLVVGSAR